MNKNKTTSIVLTALFSALCCVATMVVRIPSPLGGYINLGDGLCLLAGLTLGPVYGFAAAGLGSALADALSGYFIYIPATFLLKGALATAVWWLFKKVFKAKTLKQLIGCCALAQLITPIGYFLYEWMLYGIGAAAAIPGNLLQGVAGVVIAALLYPVIKNTFKEERL